MDLNTPEQAAEARKLLRWDWSDIALQALTKYQRRPSEPLPNQGNEVLLDIERELGGIRIDYNSRHYYTLFCVEVYLMPGERTSFGLESSGFPACEIDTMGKIHTYDNEVYDSPKTYLEFICYTLHYWHINHKLGELHSCFENRILDFSQIKDSFHRFCEIVNMPYQDKASDSRNAMWAGVVSLLQVQELADGRTSIFFRTGDPDIFDRFTAWHRQHDL